METTAQALITQQELAYRWGRTPAAIGLASALGVGPKYVKSGGIVCYPLEEVQKYERACLYFDPAEIALHTTM